ncbi:hypothetical protein GCM10007160_16770 [Litchfieldella qijiaojingensis]|uniref:MarR family transcriptional regulator n=1 Tax=Litchfieldella qijiaojingensis TaxID=980347 RepID=A0ABQ2YNG2_9GAMM|nr:MarR family transcriptional regulator [Halomonas qijiaojingensis]GGX89986.1 hypothetical protein GCM10007160_16770 [Halomonas qijiaojingensis]
MARKKPKVQWGPAGAFALPKLLMDHPDFRELSGSALKVLLALGYQHNGFNNGDLSCTSTTMSEWGGMSPTTLAKALRELQERNLIIKSRDAQVGREGPRCALYAFTWAPIDDCGGKLDISPTTTPRRRLSK